MMLGQYKLAAQIVAVCLLMMGLYTMGWIAGRHGCEQNFTIYKQQQQIIQAAQITAAKQQEAENEKQTYAIAQSYSSDIDHLQRAIARMRHEASSTSAMPAASGSSEGAYASGTACEGTEFFSKALQSELMLEAWQQWARVQNIPVR